MFTPILPDIARRGGPLATEPGRNDSAMWVSVGFIGALVLGLIGGIALFRALVEAYRVVRPGHRAGAADRGRSRRDRGKDDWPVTDDDVAVTPVFRKQIRLRLLSVIVGAGIVLHLFATTLLNDAPRAVDFAPPWPRIPDAWLLGPDGPDRVVVVGVVLVGAGVVASLAAMAGGVRDSSAQLVRYGTRLLEEQGGRTKKEVRGYLREMADGRRAEHRRGVMVALVVLAFATYATVHAVTALGAAPLPVTIAGLRDAIVLTATGVTLLVTVEPTYDRVSRLLAIHDGHVTAGEAPHRESP